MVAVSLECQHGQLARVCLTCEMEAEIADLRSLLKRAYDSMVTGGGRRAVIDAIEQELRLRHQPPTQHSPASRG